MKTGPWTHASYSKNGEKAIQCRFRLAKQQVCTTYVTFSLPSLHDYHVKLFHGLWMTQCRDFLFLFVWTIGCPTNLSPWSFSCISLKNVSKFCPWSCQLIRVFPFQLITGDISWFYVFQNSLIIHKSETKDMATLFLCPIL